MKTLRGFLKYVDTYQKGTIFCPAPAWVKSLVQEAWSSGRVEGKVSERCRLRRRAEKAMFGWPGSTKSEVMGRIFRGAR